MFYVVLFNHPCWWMFFGVAAHQLDTQNYFLSKRCKRQWTGGPNAVVPEIEFADRKEHR